MRSSKHKGSPRSNRGFTLIELLVVIAIIAVLTGIGLASFQGAQEKARNAKREGDLKAIQTALQAYYNDHGNFPGTANTWYYSGGTTSSTNGWTGSGNVIHDALVPNYIKQMPGDPLENCSSPSDAPDQYESKSTVSCYTYGYYVDKNSNCAEAQSYMLAAGLEGSGSSKLPFPANLCGDWGTTFTTGTLYPLVVMTNP